MSSVSTINLPILKYQWQKWDCFTLAKWLRTHLLLRPFPDIPVYEKYTESTLPCNYVKEMLNEYAIAVSDPQDGDLVSLRIGEVSALGTIWHGEIIFMSFSRGAVSLPIFQISGRIEGVWRL